MNDIDKLAVIQRQYRKQMARFAELQRELAEIKDQRDQFNNLAIQFRADCERLTRERDRYQARYANVNDECNKFRAIVDALVEADRLLNEPVSKERNAALRLARNRVSELLKGKS